MINEVLPRTASTLEGSMDPKVAIWFQQKSHTFQGFRWTTGDHIQSSWRKTPFLTVKKYPGEGWTPGFFGAGTKKTRTSSKKYSFHPTVQVGGSLTIVFSCASVSCISLPMTWVITQELTTPCCGPGGAPAAATNSPKAQHVKDAKGDGFSTTEQPAASAGATFKTSAWRNEKQIET